MEHNKEIALLNNLSYEYHDLCRYPSVWLKKNLKGDHTHVSLLQRIKDVEEHIISIIIMRIYYNKNIKKHSR